MVTVIQIIDTNKIYREIVDAEHLTWIMFPNIAPCRFSVVRAYEF